MGQNQGFKEKEGGFIAVGEYGREDMEVDVERVYLFYFTLEEPKCDVLKFINRN